jgi:hypothetical protein
VLFSGEHDASTVRELERTPAFAVASASAFVVS